MARARLRFTLAASTGHIIQNAAVYVYRPGTTTAPYGAMYDEETAGVVLTNPLDSDSSGTVNAWFDTAQLVDLLVTDNANAAFHATAGDIPLGFDDFTIADVPVRPGPSSDIAQSASSPVAFTVENHDNDVVTFSIASDNGEGDGLIRIFDIENNNPGPVDINFRNSTIAIGAVDPGEQKYGLGPLQFLGPAGETGNFIQAYYPGTDSGSANPVFAVNNAGTVTIAGGGLAGTALAIKVRTDAQNRFNIDELGAHNWGAGGSSATDTTLERSAANVLALGSNDALKTGAAVHASLPAATGYAAGSQFYCTTDKQPLWSDGTNWVEADGTNH